jgi:hypothetical protein
VTATAIRRIRLSTALVLGLASFAALVAYVRREARISYLLNEAVKSNENSLNALKQLGLYNDARVRKIVESIALGKISVADPTLQETAIIIVGAESNPATSVALAQMLTPNQSAGVRNNVADVLLKQGCPRACVEAVLKYLAMIFDGVLNVEEQRLQETGLGPDVARLIQQDNRELYTPN